MGVDRWVFSLVGVLLGLPLGWFVMAFGTSIPGDAPAEVRPGSPIETVDRADCAALSTRVDTAQDRAEQLRITVELLRGQLATIGGVPATWDAATDPIALAAHARAVARDVMHARFALDRADEVEVEVLCDEPPCVLAFALPHELDASVEHRERLATQVAEALGWDEHSVGFGTLRGGEDPVVFETVYPHADLDPIAKRRVQVRTQRWIGAGAGR